MLAEAMRAHLVELGVAGAETWTHEQIMTHVDRVMLSCAEEGTLDVVADDFFNHVKYNMTIVNDVLSEDLRA